MIVVDTSALIAIALREPAGRECMRVLAAEPLLAISAGTLSEALIVAARRGVSTGMDLMVQELGLEIVPVTAMVAQRVAEAYRRWGKGFHAANLNFGDCFAYALARERDCPLLYVGRDFARTDITSVLP